MAEKRSEAEGLTHEQVDRQLREILEGELKRGTPLANIRITWRGLVWAWSPIARRWEWSDAQAAREVAQASTTDGLAGS